MLLDDYKNLNEEKAPSEEEIAAQKQLQEDFDMIVEFLRESGYADLSDNYSIYDEAVTVTKDSAFGGNKKRALSATQYAELVKSMTAISVARSKNDSLVRDLEKASRLRKKLIAKIRQKYAGISNKTAKEALNKAKKSNNALIKDKKEGVGGTAGTNNNPKVKK